MSTAVIIQARVGSTRFPNKMTIPFYGDHGMLHYLLSRMKKASLSAPLILAIPDSTENDILQEIGLELGLKIFRGSENDVLQRFIDAANHYNVTSIIRVCADNPFLNIEAINALIDALNKDKSDYISFCLTDGTPTIKTHYGFWPEAVRLTTLQTVASQTDEKLYREHVTNYIYAHAEKYRCRCLALNPEVEANQWARFTVDTAQDFQNMKHLATELTSQNLLSPEQLITHVARNPNIRTSMEAEIRKNQK